MSIEKAEEFIELAQNDEELLKELAACDSDEARLELAKTRGFEFTKDDIKAAIAKTDKLADEELDFVAGGTCGARGMWSGFLN